MLHIQTKVDLAIWLCGELFAQHPTQAGPASTPKLLVSLLIPVITKGCLLTDQAQDAVSECGTDEPQLRYHDAVNEVVVHMLGKVFGNGVPVTIDDFIYAAARGLYLVENGFLKFNGSAGVERITSHGIAGVEIDVLSHYYFVEQDPNFDGARLVQLLAEIASSELPAPTKIVDRRVRSRLRTR